MNEECAKLYVSGATLAEIPDSSAYSTFAKMSVPSGISWPIWIGYTDDDVEGTFKSINGFPGNNLSWKPGTDESNNGSDEKENCVVLYNDWTMRTKSCSEKYNAMCSKVEAVTTTSTTVTTTQTTSTHSTAGSSTTFTTTSTTPTPEATTTTTSTTTIPEPISTTSPTTTQETTTTTAGTTTTPETTTTSTTITPRSTTTTPGITTRTTETSSKGKCFCLMSRDFNITKEQLQQRIDDIKSILLLDLKNLSAFKRSKVSVYEDRPISARLGALGISIMCFVAVLFILTDLGRCVKWLWMNLEHQAENDEL